MWILGVHFEYPKLSPVVRKVFRVYYLLQKRERERERDARHQKKKNEEEEDNNNNDDALVMR